MKRKINLCLLLVLVLVLGLGVYKFNQRFIVSFGNDKLISCRNHKDDDLNMVCDVCKVELPLEDYAEDKKLISQNNSKLEVSGFMPKNSKLEAKKLENSEAIYLTKKYGFSNKNVVTAFDISINVADRKYQPLNYGETLEVKISNLYLDTKKTYELLHILDDENYEVVPIKSISEGEVVFVAKSFSTYILTTEDAKTLSFEGENYVVLNESGDEITNGATIPAGESFTFNVMPNNHYGVTGVTCNLESGDSAISVYGDIRGRNCYIPEISENLTVNVETALAPTITEQPTSKKVLMGSEAVFSITASDATTYEWQYREDKDSLWKSISTNTSLGSGHSSSSFTLKSTGYETSGYQFRCLVGNANFTNHERVISDVVTISIAQGTFSAGEVPIIIEQPNMSNAKVVTNSGKASFSVQALGGSDMTFNWQYRKDENSLWEAASNSGIVDVDGTSPSIISTEAGETGDRYLKKSTLTLKATNYSASGYQFRCLVGNTFYTSYNAVKSDVVTLSVADGTYSIKAKVADVKITSNPVSAKVKLGESATFSVTAENADSYLWQYKASGEGSWINVPSTISSTAETKDLVINTSSVTQDENLVPTGELVGAMFRCLVWHSNVENYKLQSDPAVLSIAQDTTTTEATYAELTHPSDVVTGNNKEVSFSASFGNGISGLTYEWHEVSGDNDTNLVDTNLGYTGANTSTLTIPASLVTLSLSGAKYYCKIGNMTTNLATLTVIDETKQMVTVWSIPEDNTTIKLPVSGKVDITIDWGDGTTSSNVTTEFPEHTYEVSGDYTIKVSGSIRAWGYRSTSSINSTSSYYTYVQYITKVCQLGELGATEYGFSYCRSLVEISGENLVTEKTFEKVTNMQYMFYECRKLTSLDVSKFDTSKVNSMYNMFYGCKSLSSLDLSGFDTSKVTSMQSMFSGCSSLTSLDVSSFDTSNVTTMWAMFSGCSSLTSLDLSGFDTSNVTTMCSMFYGCKSLSSLDLSGFDTSSVTSMWAMFYNCKSLSSLDLSGFVTSSVTEMSFTFTGCSSLTSLDVSSFDTSNVTGMDSMFNGCKSLCSLDLSGFVTPSVTDMNCMFANCNKLTNLDLNGFDTSNVINMSYMFSSCSSLISLDVSGFDTSNVTNMSWMFRYCSSLISLDVSGFDTSNVTNMSYMFEECSNLTSLDVSGFDTPNVTDMSYMFEECSNLTSLDVSSFDTSNVTNMECMFNICTNLKSLQLSKKFVITSYNVTDMFKGVTNLTAIIMIDEEPLTSQFRSVKSQLSGKTFYVPNVAESAYENAWSGDFSADRIKPIIELVGENPVSIIKGMEYSDNGYIVAGFTGADAKYYTCYGYSVETQNDVDTKTAGSYEVKYILNRNNTQNSVVTRVVNVLGVPNAPQNFVATDKASENTITLTWEAPQNAPDGIKYKLEVLNDSGNWESLSENASSPHAHSSLEKGKVYEYRLSAISKEGVSSDFVYAIGATAKDSDDIIVRNDTIAPIIEVSSILPNRKYVNSSDTVTLKLNAIDDNYKYSASNILASDVTVFVGGIVNNDVNINVSKLKIASGEEYTFEISNITSSGELAIKIGRGKIVDKAGNENMETLLEMNILVANDTITNNAPTVTVDENEITIKNNQESIVEITKIEYLYKASGDDEFSIIPNGESGDTPSFNRLDDALADTTYEIKTRVTDEAGNVVESKVTTIKTDAMDSTKISILANPTTYTSGDVFATITYNSKFRKEYSLDGQNYIKVADGYIKDLVIKQNTVIYARFSDGKNVSQAVTYNVNNIDKEKPIIGNVSVSPTGKANKKIITASNIEDAGVSGVFGYFISNKLDLENPTWNKLTGNTFNFECIENVDYYIWVIDNAGNISEAKTASVSGIVDKVDNINYTDSFVLSVGEIARLDISYSGEAMGETYISSDSGIVKAEKNIRQIEGMSSGDAIVTVTIKDYDGEEHVINIYVTVIPTNLDVKLMSDGVLYNGDWTNKDVLAILRASGMKPNNYKEKDFSGDEWRNAKNAETDEITGITTITYSGDFSGEKFYVGANSNDGFVTTVAGGFTIKLDKTPPTMGIASKDVGSNSIGVKILNAEDSLSGIKEYEIGIYKDGNCLATCRGASGEATFAGLASSTTYQIKYKIFDNAGNETDMIDGGSNTTGVIKKFVTYDYATNSGDGIVGLESSETGSAKFETVAGTMVDLSITATKKGYNFKGWSKTPDGDVLNSLVMPEEDITLYAIFKDEDAPNVTDKSYETIDGVLDIIVKADDDGSGIDKVAVTTDEGNPNGWDSPKFDDDGNIRITVPGTNKYFVWIKDLAGNILMYEQVAIKDILAPTGNIEVKENIVNGLPYANRNLVNLKITASDDVSTGADIKIAVYNEADYKNIKRYSDIDFKYSYIDGGLELQHQTTAGDGLKRIYVIFKDKAGNISMTIKQIGD